MLKRCAWAALALLAACPNGIPQPPAALPDTCSGDSECGANFRCDHDLRRCVCKSDAACPGKYCNAFTGQCVETIGGCKASADCGASQYCNTALRACRAITPFCRSCRSDAECGAGSACAAHPDFPAAGTFCVSACDAQGNCANGLSCRKDNASVNLCYPANACGDSNACVPDSLKLCAADADCADPNQSCDQTLKACIARNATCPAGSACDPQSHLCVHACSVDADCALIEGKPGFQCRANACFALARCTQDSDCTSGQICQTNPDTSKTCHPGCVSNADCPLGSGCNATDPNHPRCAPGCTQNTDCALNTVCVGGACVPATGNCAQACQATAVCSIGGTCSNACCVEANLAVTCGSTGCPACTGSGCNLNCADNCYPLELGPCSSLSQCAKYGAGAVCNPQLGQCQVLGHLQSCASSADCPMKGFNCIPASQFGCGGAGNLCFPTEQAAQVACALGHP